MSNPKFSIIIPVLKRRKFAVQAIRSVLGQSGVKTKEIQIIVSDDEVNRIKLLKNKKFYQKLNRNILYTANNNVEGPGGNRQTGLSLAKGNYVTFLDSDDRLRVSFLARMGRLLDNNKFVAAICLSDSVYERGFNPINRLKILPLVLIRDLALLLAYILNGKSLYTGAFYLCQMSHMMFKRNHIQKLKFNYDYRRGGEDWDFFSQTLKEGRIRIVPQKLLLFRYSPQSSTLENTNKIYKWKSYLLLLERLPKGFKRGIFYPLLLAYIYIFGGKYATK